MVLNKKEKLFIVLMCTGKLISGEQKFETKDFDS